MTTEVTAVHCKEAGNTSVFDLVVGSDLLGKFWVNRISKRSWSELSVPTLVEPASASTDLFRDFTRRVYQDLYGEFAEGMYQQCTVALGGLPNPERAWLNSEQTLFHFHRLLDRMKQRNSLSQWLRFETSEDIGCASFSLQRNAAERPGTWASALVSRLDGWTPDLVAWTLGLHANQDLATSIEVVQLNQLLSEATLPGQSLVA